MRMAGDKLIWFKGRATPVVASSVKAARDRGAAGSKGEVVATRSPNQAERAKIAKGQWVRARPPGTPQRSDAGPSTFRPQLRAKAKGHQVS
jgi:hypothetical protein